jgi:hypothetical protein
MLKRLCLVLASWLASTAAWGQPTTAAVPQPSALSDIDIIVKIIAGAFAALATLLGLPIVLLTYRKTRAEIGKLELEAQALRQSQIERGQPPGNDSGNIRIIVDNSPNVSVQVLADPRFLAPLLILLDFILAWIILALADAVLSIFGFDVVKAPALAILTALLLVPIARQVLRVRAVLQPPRTTAELRASQRQIRVAACTLFLTLVVSCAVVGAFLSLGSNVWTSQRYVGVGLIIIGVTLLVAGPFARRRLDRYLLTLHQIDSSYPTIET